MRYLFIGAGAIGSYLGGALIKAGKQVFFLEKPEFYQRLKDNGLHLVLRNGQRFDTEISVFGNPQEAFQQSPDIVIFAMKSFDTQAAAQTISPYLGNVKAILCFQNGVENEDTIRKYSNGTPVISATLTSAIGKTPNGEIVLERFRGVGIEKSGELTERVWQDFTDADVNPVLFDSAADMKWSKMISNLLLNSTCAILDMTPAEVMNYKEVFRLEVEQIRETLRVMRALSISPVNLPRVPVALLAGVIRFVPADLSRIILRKPLAGGRGAKMPSFHIDLHLGKRESEVEYLNGAVVRYGAKVGLQTPVNRALCDLLTMIAKDPELVSEYRHSITKLLTQVNLLKQEI